MMGRDGVAEKDRKEKEVSEAGVGKIPAWRNPALVPHWIHKEFPQQIFLLTQTLLAFGLTYS